MMKTILVPTDYSSCAGNAAVYAAHLAADMGAKVLLLHVFHVPVSTTPDVPNSIPSIEILQEEQDHEILMAATMLESKSHCQVEGKALMGLAVDVILEELHEADLVVMGMHGVSKLEEALLGSITTTIMRKSNLPVLAIPERAGYHHVQKVVFACDFRHDSDIQSLDDLKMVLQPFKPEILILHVKPINQTPPVAEAITQVRMEAQLKELEHHYHYMQQDDAVSGINEFVDTHQAQLVALIPHRYQFFERWFHRSITKKLAFHAHVPLLALPEKREKGHEYEA